LICLAHACFDFAQTLDFLRLSCEEKVVDRQNESRSFSRRDALKLAAVGSTTLYGIGAFLKPASAQVLKADAYQAPNVPWLPQDDPDLLQRAIQLAEQQQQYQYNFSYFPPLPLVDKVPPADQFTLPWQQLANAIETDRRSNITQAGQARTIEKLDDYAALFPVIPLPQISKTFQEDSVFARMRVAGPNPVVIERVMALDNRFPVTDEHYQSVMGEEDSLGAAGQEGRLYLADYAIFDGAANGSYAAGQKYLYAPLALFAIPRPNQRSRSLVPVAIQCGQKPGPDNPIFTPKNGTNWLLAKTIVQIADANFHELIIHLGSIHLFIEPLVIATQRQLAARHPLGILLRPHFEGTLATNFRASFELVNPGGPVDRLLGATLDSSRAFAVEGVRSYPFNDSMLPDTLKRRGVDDRNLLPDYPYRDDGLLIWYAIRHWVKDYLNIYYRSDADVECDSELQNWLSELLSVDGGRMVGIGQDGRIQTRDYLIEATTLILFTASAQHAAIGTPQRPLMTYAPAFPLAGYSPAPVSNQDATESDYLRLLPPWLQAQGQLNTLYLLGTVDYTRLGRYQNGYFSDERVQPKLERFQARLERIEAVIVRRNQMRPVYEFLLPSQIPQTIQW
jgi:arachidonate 15-lipoxygenase